MLELCCCYGSVFKWLLFLQRPMKNYSSEEKKSGKRSAQAETYLVVLPLGEHYLLLVLIMSALMMRMTLEMMMMLPAVWLE